MATGKEFVLVLLRYGTVAHWSGSAEFESWAKNPENIVMIEAGAYKSDIRVFKRVETT